ncbi:hypothetical protein CEXT_570901 [Caerostris extrusa]|uniref:Uncharacterized protein n=1 Tax=Caerostris extrusa TaxID=172846 RepID=A0AAV4WPC1_CAEEX|nr:hypothetical protein CEXT_570901 [Caerostris extrusa]
MHQELGSKYFTFKLHNETLHFILLRSSKQTSNAPSSRRNSQERWAKYEFRFSLSVLKSYTDLYGASSYSVGWFERKVATDAVISETPETETDKPECKSMMSVSGMSPFPLI